MTIIKKLYKFAKSISNDDLNKINKDFNNILHSDIKNMLYKIKNDSAIFYVKLTENEINSLDLIPLYIPKRSIHKNILDILCKRVVVRYVEFERCSYNILIIYVKFENQKRMKHDYDRL